MSIALESRISLGCDPEIFVTVSKKQASCHKMLPGTKKDPYPVSKGAVQVDGTAAEFNILPAKTGKEFCENIESVLTDMKNMLKSVDPSADFLWKPVRKYNKDVWKQLPDSAKEMGCDPDFNAYTGMENDRPHSDFETLRSAGGHIHIGWATGADIQDERHLLDCRIVVSALDAILFPLSLRWDKDETRRLLYGKPGAYRPKSYGVEYRTLSNMWVKSENTRMFVSCITRTVLEWLRKEDFDPSALKSFMELFRDASNGNESSKETLTSGKFFESLPEYSYLKTYINHYVKKYGV